MIIYGAQYYRPPFPRSQAWKSDLARIKACHFNTVKLWAVWSWIERTEGEYYFQDLDELIDLCVEIGLNVVINTIPEGMPYWLSRRHSDAKDQTSDGYCVEMSGAANLPSGGAPGLCADKAEVQARVCEFIRQVVARYAGRDAVIAFDVWNEPHLEPIFDYPEQLFCYCEHSQTRFGAWLQGKYGSIEALNEAWMRAYTGWEDVMAPVRFGTYPDMIDWRHFWLENLAAWLEARVQAARSAANGKTIMTHVSFSGYIGGSGAGGLGYHLGDEFLLAPQVDQFGLTSFPKWLMQNDFVQHLVNLELVAASAGEKAFWQSELQAGAGKWEARGRTLATPEEIRLWNWSALACGAKGILYWQWKPEPSGMEAPGFGLTGLDGGLSARTEAARSCALAFNRPSGLEQARPIPAVNGIFVSRTADLWWHAAGKGESLYASSLYGAYRACFEAGVPARMVHADQLPGILKEGLQVLYLPAAVALSDVELAGLRSFVLGGGTLVAEACPGLFDERGILREDASFLKEVFGLAVQEVDHQSVVRVQYLPGMEAAQQASAYSGRYYRQDFQQIDPDVRILGQFEDGRPAVFESAAWGLGRAILSGTFAAAAVAMDGDADSAGFITHWMNPTGYDRLTALTAGKKTLTRLQQSPGTLYVTTVNYSHSAQEIQMTFDRPYRLCEQQAQGVLDRRQRRLWLHAPARDGALIWLEETD